MKQHCVLHDSKSQTCSAKFATSPLVDSVEPFEEAWQVFPAHTQSVVDEAEIPVSIFFVSIECDCRSVASIGYCVVGEIAEHTIEQAFDTLNHNAFREIVQESHLSFVQFQCRLLLNVAHQLADVYDLNVHHLRSVVHSVER